MLSLLTSNPAKYAPFKRELDRMRITLETGGQGQPELQTLNFEEALTAKARHAAAVCGQPVLVDDAGLVLEAYAPFPGPLTSTVLRSLGLAGLRRLLQGVSDRARMECHLGCWLGPDAQGEIVAQPSTADKHPAPLRLWSGSVEGRLDLSREPRDPRMPLSDLFVPDVAPKGGTLLHRARALAALEADAFGLHLDVASRRPPNSASCPPPPAHGCPFCAEFEQDGLSIFAEMMGDRLESRVVYQDDDFVVMPPLGQFIQGGLLLLTRKHLLSFAYLPPELFGRLERLLTVISAQLQQRWGVAPLVFEHGPAPQWGKGVCCVDHAHFNIFPARLELHPHLADRPHINVASLADLARLRAAELGYLFVQENEGQRRAYDGSGVPTQLVRRIITQGLGMPERWHWRDYLGQEELVSTYKALRGQIRL